MHTNGESGRLTMSGLDPEVIRLFKSRAALAGQSLAEYFTTLVHDKDHIHTMTNAAIGQDIRGGRPGL